MKGGEARKKRGDVPRARLEIFFSDRFFNSAFISPVAHLHSELRVFRAID